VFEDVKTEKIFRISSFQEKTVLGRFFW